jgi:hypothetical protein
MRLASLYLKTIMATLAMVFAFQSAAAEAPGKPIEFTATVVENGTMVKLNWMANREGGTPKVFCIFIAEGETDDEANFTLLVETDIRAGQNGLYSYVLRDLDPGKYSIYIKAKNDDGASGRSIIRVVTLKGEDPKTGKPGTPGSFDAKVVEEGTIVKLMWTNNWQGGTPKVFCIFMAEGETEDMDDFELIEEVDYAPNTQVYYHYVRDLQPGVYSFYVVAKNDDGASERTKIRVVVMEDPDALKIHIISRPSSGAKEGTPWDYQVKTEANFTPTSITYELVHAPDGMTIDDNGKIVWDEPKNGRYEICVIVTATDGTETVTAKQCWVLEVGEGKNEEEEEKKCATIYGTVKADDANSSPIMEGVVYAWRAGNNANNKDRGRVYKAEIRQGTYSMSVPAGKYRLSVEGPGFHKEWYEDADNADDATEVEVTCENPRNAVNFVVSRRPEPTMHMVCGTVYDAETNEPIHNALITFEWRGENDNKPNGNHKRIVTESGSDGKYCVKLPEGYTYIASAVARTPNKPHDKYHHEWYDNTHNAAHATGITITGDMDGVDFPMDEKEPVEGGFGGKMMDHESGNGVPGKVIAYMIKEAGNSGNEKSRRAYTTETDDNGEYSFDGIDAGVYVVMGLPADRPWVPGWYVAGDLAADSWKNGTRIEVGNVMLTVQHDIRLDKVTDGIGRGRANGWVYDRRNGFIEKSGSKVQKAEGIQGSLVIARDEDGNVVDYAVSIEGGVFTLTSLGYGVTTLHADAMDFDPSTSMVTISTSARVAESQIGLQPIVSSVEVPTHRVGFDMNLYPNPASDRVTLSIPTQAGTADVRIVSSTGVVYTTSSTDVFGGTTNLELGTKDLPAGMYLIHVTNGTSTFALPLSIVR